MPVANAGPDQFLYFQYSTTMAAVLGVNESGVWSVIPAKEYLLMYHDPTSVVNDLDSGENIISWIVTNGVCPADTDKVIINVEDLKIPTLITPNGDTKNEYFVIMGLQSLEKLN